ncbi:MAG: lipid-A-disaccharide synthase [bacterium]
MNRPREILVIAGEISGDMHAAGLIRAIKKADPSIRFYGIGGPRLRAEGVETYYDVRDMAVMGIVEVLKRILFFRRVFRKMEVVARERKPDAVLLVDYPGFNLRFAASAHRMGIRVIYYICPQVWAWNRGRIPKMAAVVDRLMAIFPFEKEVFTGTGLAVDFVGHPLVSEIQDVMKGPLTPLPWEGDPKIGLLPGSRHHEIDRMLPTFCAAAVLIEKTFPGASFIIPTPSPEIGEYVKRRLAGLLARPKRLHVVPGDARQVFRQSRGAIVKSGTATMESALIGCPTVIVYKVASLTYQFARRVVKIPFIGIVNIIANRKICPELIQDEATAEALAAALTPLLPDTAERRAMLAGFEEVRGLLGGGGAAEQAATVVLEELNKAKKMP